MSKHIEEAFQESIQAKTASLELLKTPLENVIKRCIECVKCGGTIFWAGNGGSMADAQHMAAELVCRFKKNRKAIRSVALTTNLSTMTAIANDFGYDQVYSRELEALGQPKDVLIAISTSGNSANILLAAQTARKMGITVVGLTGKTGGKLAAECDLLLNVPSPVTARIQEVHFLMEHILCEAIEDSV